MRINDLPLSTKFWGLVIGVLVAMTSVTCVCQRHARAVHDDATERLLKAENLITLVTQWRAISQRNTELTLGAALLDDPVDAAFIKQRQKAGIAESSGLQKRIIDAVTSERGKAQSQQMLERRQGVLALVKRVGELRAQGDKAALRTMVEREYLPAVAVYDQAQGDMLKQQEEERDQANAAAQAELDRAALLALFAEAGVLALAIVATLFLLRSVTGPLQQVVASAESIARGDLTHALVSARRDEIGRMMQAMGTMRQQLRKLVHEVRQGVVQVDEASTEIAAGNQDLSTRTEHTAASLQKTSSSLDQATVSARRSTELASEADQVANGTQDAAVRSGQAVSDVVDRMQQIATSSRKIADITGVIDGIAFQTNILALNAAVEAARAGEQGRGFAVVASEVRTLAQRSGEAAREIRQLIAQSVETVDAGSRQVSVAKTVIDDVVEGVRRVTGLIGSVSQASTEQRAGLEEINRSVHQLDEVTQQNAALVEQAAAAAASLRDQSQRLAQTVAVFRTET